MTTLVNTVVESMISRKLVKDRYDPLRKIQEWVARDGFFCIAKDYGVLVNGSAEDFAVSFMNTWNEEAACGYNGY